MRHLVDVGGLCCKTRLLFGAAADLSIGQWQWSLLRAAAQ
jgi:hypothetical protein